MAALTIPPAGAAPAPGPVPAAGASTGASGFGTALESALGAPPTAADAGPDAAAQAAAPPAPAADAGGTAQPQSALLGGAAALAALLGRLLPAAPSDAAATPPPPTGTGLAGQADVGQPATPLAGDGTASGAVSSRGTTPRPLASPPPASQGDTPDVPLASGAAAPIAGDPGALEAGTRPEHGKEDRPTDQPVAAPGPGDVTAALLSLAMPPVPQPTGAPSPTGPAANAPAAAVAGAGGPRGATGSGRSSRAADDGAATSTVAPTLPDANAASVAAAQPISAPAQADHGSTTAPAAQLAPVAAAQQPLPAAPIAGPATPVVATTDPSLGQQLQGPLLSLRSAPEGEHVLVVRVSPDHLGPVTVHATVSHGDLTVQLFAASTGARDALSSMLTDLRRDLGAGSAGSVTTLSLGTGDAPQQEGRGQQAPTTWFGTGTGTGPGGGPAWQDRATRGAAPRAAEDIPTDRPILSSSSALLDVLA